MCMPWQSIKAGQRSYVCFLTTLLKAVLHHVQGPEVEYALRCIPLGGYVAFPDDDPEQQYPADDPDLLSNRPIRDRALVISAGVIANVIFAWTLLFTQVRSVLSLLSLSGEVLL